MTPEHAIAKLQRQLARHGQNVDLRKIVNGQIQSEALAQRAFVRGYKPDELVGPIQQGDRIVVLLPDALAISFKRVMRSLSRVPRRTWRRLKSYAWTMCLCG
ncbi:hypothetical protein [Brucella rhizosphaerae]|uniref:hypothetical protein n=1 Tax=Brucella rhizosphaerae TaxID=571254 RepID=UPI00360FB6E1